MVILSRKKRVEQAIANQRLEGLTVSEFTKSVLNDYAEGKISIEEAKKKVFTHYGVKYP